jgi:hypothetical protein
MAESEVSAANELLAGLGLVWVHLAEYRITHGYVHVLLTTQGFSALANVYLANCSFICGPTSGGPWSVGVTEDGNERGLVLTAGELVVRALRVQVQPTEVDSR